MEEKSDLRTRFAKSIRCRAHRLGALFTGALEEFERAAKERGHLATRTDHAFMGCNPCPPADMFRPVAPVVNMAAIPRPGKGDD